MWRLIELQGEKDKSIIIVGDFYIPLSMIDRASRQKINKYKEDLNNTLTNLASLTFIEHSVQQQQNT